MSNLIRDVEFKYNCIPFNTHPLLVRVDNRLLSLVGAMHWVVTGDEALLASNYAFI